MKGINKHNLDDWCFRYHEGLLSERQREELMSFLYKHPEHNEEFVVWANARATVDEDMVDMDLENSLLRKVPPAVAPSKSNTFWMSGVAIFAIAVVGLYWVYEPFVSNKTVTKPMSNRSLGTLPHSPKVLKIVSGPSILEKKQSLERRQKQAADQSTGLKEEQGQILYTPDTTVVEVSGEGLLVSQTLATDSVSEVKDRETTMTTSETITEIPAQEKPVIPKSNKKGKISLKPAQKFTKDHSDF